jgi:hypothetical protein
VNDLNPKIDDEDVEAKDDIVRGLCTVSVVVLGLCLTLVVARMGCTVSKLRTDYTRKFGLGHRPCEPRVAYLPVLEVRARIVARASLAYISSVQRRIRKHYFRLASFNRGPDDTHTHSTGVHVSGVVCGWTVSGSQPRCKAHHSTLITHNIEG